MVQGQMIAKGELSEEKAKKSTIQKPSLDVEVRLDTPQCCRCGDAKIKLRDILIAVYVFEDVRDQKLNSRGVGLIQRILGELGPHALEVDLLSLIKAPW